MNWYQYPFLSVPVWSLPGGVEVDIASTMRVPTARFVEWQHPDVKAVLRAEAHRGRVVATQAQILLAFSVSAPLISRFVGATVLPSAAFSGVIDTLAVLGVALALYRLLPLTVSSRVIASDEVGAERARRDGTLSPQQRALLGDSYVPRTERKSRAHADDASAGSQPADQPLRRRSSVADARFGAGRSADKRDCVAPMFVGIGPLSPRYVSVPAGRGIVTSSAGRMISNAHGERGDRVELSRTPDSTDHAGSRGPRVESDARDVDAHIASLGAAIDNSFAGRDGSDSTFKKTIQFESYNGEFDGSAQATPSPSYVGREALAAKCRQKVCFSAPKIMSEALEHPPLRSGLLQERISIDLHLHHELGRPRLGDLLVWIYREFPLRRVIPLPYSRHCTQTALHQWRYGLTVFANGLHLDCSSHLQSSCSVATW